MIDVAEDIHCDDDVVVDIGVSLDGTWQRRGFSAKKSRFFKYIQFATAIFDATAHFNVGNLATRMIYDKLDIERGYYTTKNCIDDNFVRINNARRKSSDEYQGRRKFIRGEKKRKFVNRKKQEERFMDQEWLINNLI